MTSFFKAFLVIAAMTGFASHAHAESGCVSIQNNQFGQRVLINNCPFAVSVTYCGVNPTGDASLDCNRNKKALQGLNSGGKAIVGDSRGSYSRVHWYSCQNTSPRTRWDGQQLMGTCEQ